MQCIVWHGRCSDTNKITRSECNALCGMEGAVIHKITRSECSALCGMEGAVIQIRLLEVKCIVWHGRCSDTNKITRSECNALCGMEDAVIQIRLLEVNAMHCVAWKMQ